MLGRLDLRDPSGRELRKVLVQRRRLALLAHLAASTPYRFHRRDSLMALFWPELDQAHARAALRQAVYVLREALGPGVIVSRGEAEIGLNADVLWCDAPAFDRALDARLPVEALELYRGDLLEGFFISDAWEFESWLEFERARLRHRAAAAAWLLVDSAVATEDLPSALYWARRAWTLSPDDEESLRRFIALLDRLGDRVEAIHAYLDFARRAAQVYQVQPSPETETLVERVRARAAEPAEAAGDGPDQRRQM